MNNHPTETTETTTPKTRKWQGKANGHAPESEQDGPPFPKPPRKRSTAKKVLGDAEVPDATAPEPPKRERKPVPVLSHAQLLKKAASLTEAARKLRERANLKQKAEKLKDAKQAFRDAEASVKLRTAELAASEKAVGKARARLEAMMQTA